MKNKQFDEAMEVIDKSILELEDIKNRLEICLSKLKDDESLDEEKKAEILENGDY